jgi:hypothetical protein
MGAASYVYNELHRRSGYTSNHCQLLGTVQQGPCLPRVRKYEFVFKRSFFGKSLRHLGAEEPCEVRRLRT